MFKKLVAIENTLLHEDALKKLSDYAACVELHDERAADEDELIRRIGDADAVLVSFKTTISKTVLDACPNIRYQQSKRTQDVKNKLQVQIHSMRIIYANCFKRCATTFQSIIDHIAPT